MSGIYCRFYIVGNCRYGDQCRYSHDISRLPVTSPEVCWFNLAGICTRGENCRFAHVDESDLEYLSCAQHNENDDMSTKLEDQEVIVPTSAFYNCENDESFQSLQVTSNFGTCSIPSCSNFSSESSFDISVASSRPLSGCEENAIAASDDRIFNIIDDYLNAPDVLEEENQSTNEVPSKLAVEDALKETNSPFYDISNVKTSLSNEVLCPEYEKKGFCANKECTLLNGERCGICGNYSLHPFDQKQRENHHLDCLADQEVKVANMEACSIDKMCGICMEVVWKKEGKERRFGLLENCNHVFCLDCIRKWRASSQYEASVAKGCPECRVKSDYITPSRVWYETPEQKAEIIEAYKQNLSKIHCKYFKNGQGSCPFGNKCFYLHVYEDGTKAVLGSPVTSRRRRQVSFDADSASELFFINVMDSQDGLFDVTMADLDFVEYLDSMSSSNSNLSDYLNEEFIFDFAEGDVSSMSNSLDSLEIFNSPS